MNNNEKDFVESIVNLNANIFKAQKYVKENFNIDSEYDEENNILHIYTKNINESLQLASAKEYIEENIGSDLLNVQYGF